MKTHIKRNKTKQNKTRRNKTKNNNKYKKGGINFRALIVGAVALLSSALTDAKTCGAETLVYQEQFLGKGAYHAVTTSIDGIGAQKQFNKDEALEVAVALHLSREGLFAPIIEECSANKNGEKLYILTSERLAIKANRIFKSRLRMKMDSDTGQDMPNMDPIELQPGWENSFNIFKEKIQLYKNSFGIEPTNDVIEFYENGTIAWINTGNIMADKMYGTIYIIDADMIVKDILKNPQYKQTYMDELNERIPDIDDTNGVPMNNHDFFRNTPNNVVNDSEDERDKKLVKDEQNRATRIQLKLDYEDIKKEYENLKQKRLKHDNKKLKKEYDEIKQEYDEAKREYNEFVNSLNNNDSKIDNTEL